MLRAVGPEEEQAWPDAGERPLVFLLDASGGLERRLLADWIDEHRPAGASFRAVTLPPSRRRAREVRNVSTDLREALDGDPVLVPARVVWMAGKRRTPSLMRLLTFGDPRDPNRFLQELIVRFRPDRVRIVVGDTAPVSELRSRWREARTDRPDEPFGFAEFVALQAMVALEVAERRIRGNRYKVPRFVADDILSRASFRSGVARLAEESGEDPEALFRRCAHYLDEIAASHSTYVIDLVAALIRVLYTQGYDRRIQYDRAALERLAELGRSGTVAFLPSHKSNMDHLALTHVLYENGFPPNHTAGGINMNFFPIGPLIRRAGVFFIRRRFRDNEPYKFVLKRYIDFLLENRFPLEWFMEGGRSRSGKLREPRYGMLSYVADSYRRGSCEDVILIPTSLAYDQIQDVGSYAAEQSGRGKEKESFRWFVKAVSMMRRRYGRIHVDFGEPLRLSETLSRYEAGEELDPEDVALEIQKVAFEVAVRINRVTPITPISLVTFALLQTPDTALTVAETVAALDGVQDHVEARGLPVTERVPLDDPDTVRAALDALVEHGVVTRFDDGPEPVYGIGTEQHLSAAFYRNTIVHHFVNLAVAEVALAAVAEGGGIDAFWDAVRRLRDVLKFEFFFSERDEFRAEITAELAHHGPAWEEAVAAGRANAVLVAIDPQVAPSVLRHIFEAYLVTADAVAAHDFRRDIDRKELVEECLARGRQYRLQRRIRSPESISTVLFDSAIRLAENRDVLEGGDHAVFERREAFAAEMREVVGWLG
jgi:glycerol-3-phosphate O-acyltransferase